MDWTAFTSYHVPKTGQQEKEGETGCKVSTAWEKGLKKAGEQVITTKCCVMTVLCKTGTGEEEWENFVKEMIFKLHFKDLGLMSKEK